MSDHRVSFGGIVPPLCTPFTASYEVDVPSLQRLIRFQLDAGVHGLFVLGSTGEAVFLTDDQREQVIEVTVRTVAGQVPVFAGIIDTTTAPSIDHARVAAQLGADALVMTAPFYARTSQPEILEHFRLVRSITALPLVAYEIPSAVHASIHVKTIIQLAEEGTIAALKDSSEDEARFRSILLSTRHVSGFSVFTGSELVCDAALMFGAHGVVPGLGNVDPDGYIRLWEAARAGDWDTARKEQERLFRLFAIVDVGSADRMGRGASAYGAFKTGLMLRGVIETNVTGRPQPQLLATEVELIRDLLIASGIQRQPVVASSDSFSHPARSEV